MSTSQSKRLPLEWVIEHPAYMGPLWAQLSVPQQTFVKVSYGLPLATLDEYKAYATFMEQAEYDELGYVTRWTPTEYVAQEYDTIVGLVGRRGGKSLLTCFMSLYEILFGGHMEHVMPGQDVVVPYVAQDLATAKSNMQYIRLLCQQVPKLAKEIVNDARDHIRFKNGIVVQPEPPTIKTGRGISVPVIIMDEVGFWYKTSENVNPDYEVLAALRNAQTQFPHSKRFIISTPYTEEGVLWDYWRAGSRGHKLDPHDPRKQRYQRSFVAVCSTAAFENPEIHKLGRQKIQAIYDDDPDIFPRESLAQFIASESNFLPGRLIDACTDKTVTRRFKHELESQEQAPTFVAVMDPAFRNDDFTFTIGHMREDGVVVQDFIHVWSPDKRAGIKLEPVQILGQIGQWLKEWGIPIAYSDQYHLESLVQLARQQGFEIIGQDFTGRSKAKIYGSLEQLLKTQRIRLLDVPEIRQQLSQLNKKNTALGNVQIGAPPGKKDDVATVVALLAHITLQYQPVRREVKRDPTLFEYNVQKIRERQDGGLRWSDDW